MSKKPAAQAQTSSDILDLSILDTILNETQEFQYEKSPIEEAWIRNLKVYNVMPPNKPEKSMEGKIIYPPSSKEEIYWTEIEGSILAVRKYWDWFTPTKNFNEDWKVVQEYYSTNQLWIFETQWVKFKGFVWIEENKSYENQPVWIFTTRELMDIISDENSKFFKEWKTTVDWSEKYKESRISKKIVVYIKTANWIVALNPWASYWKYSNIKDWTLEFIKEECAKELKVLWKDFKKASLELCKVKWVVTKDWKYDVIKWQFEWFVDNSIIEDRELIKWLIDKNNEYNFKFNNTPVLKSWEMEKVLLETPQLENLPY